MSSKDRFIIQPSESRGDYLVCTDTVNLVVCKFRKGAFNESQEFTLLDDTVTMHVDDLARIAREMGDWLREYHYDVLFT